MAIDGSFSLEFALQRFLTRCPKLRSRASFESLSKQEMGIRDEEVVDVLAEVFLHPSYTIPLIGCFRPLAQRILDKEVSLLRLVPNLRSNSSSSVMGNEKILKEFENVGGNVIDHYHQSGMGLNLHELACLAFSRACDLAPFLLGSMLEYFKFAPPPFQRILNEGMNQMIQKFEEPLSVSDPEKLPEEEVGDPLEGQPQKYSDSIVRLKKPSANDEILQLGKMSINSDEVSHSLANRQQLDISDEAKANAASAWRRYELRTTRLSQELAEQLRLVMEPTGKRINMKKVISYIASHYRKDKIWQRRTRPNKRDYQVVIAVDDSRSMSESGCGTVAVEALVTVCRALSQLEMGSLAVASFGKEGNMRLLHEFDRPFSTEAGIKMVSNLTFKQESSLADEPVVDLLKNLDNLLNANVARARLSSGQNPLQQLVLILGDGRFHEKKSLRRCVRDFQSSKRMVAFLLLDSPEESIMDLSEVSFQGSLMKSSKYMDSFPFPYYVVLRNIEALPRTLADLLRQWFELMQQVRD